jgi:pyridoxamine 5'-phosphate oxidase
MNVTIFIDDALKTIQRGTVDRKSPFKLPALSTSTDNKVFQRIVVARRFIEHDQSLIIYTDYESQKYHQLKTNPSCSLLFWDQKKRLQVQVAGEAYFLDDKLNYWDKLNENQKKDYVINPLPGTEISSSDSYSYDSAEHRFEVISIHFKTLDVLELSPDGHRRAKSILNKNGRKDFWLAP